MAYSYSIPDLEPATYIPPLFNHNIIPGPSTDPITGYDDSKSKKNTISENNVNYLVKYKVTFEFPNSRVKPFNAIWEVSAATLSRGGNDVKNALIKFARDQTPPMDISCFRMSWRLNAKGTTTVCNYDFYNDDSVRCYEEDFHLVFTAFTNPYIQPPEDKRKKRKQSEMFDAVDLLTGEEESSGETEEPPKKKPRSLKKKKLIGKENKKKKLTRSQKRNQEMDEAEEDLENQLPDFIKNIIDEEDLTKYSFLRTQGWSSARIIDDIMMEKHLTIVADSNRQNVASSLPPTVGPGQNPATVPNQNDMQSNMMSSMHNIMMMRMMDKLMENNNNNKI